MRRISPVGWLLIVVGLLLVVLGVIYLTQTPPNLPGFVPGALAHPKANHKYTHKYTKRAGACFVVAIAAFAGAWYADFRRH